MTDASSAYPYIYPNPAAFPNGMAMTPNPFGQPASHASGMFPMGMNGVQQQQQQQQQQQYYGPHPGMYAPMQAPYYPQHFGYPYRAPSLLSQLPWWLLPLTIAISVFLLLWYCNPSWLRTNTHAAELPCHDLPASDAALEDKEPGASRNYFKILMTSIFLAAVGSVFFVVYRVLKHRQQAAAPLMTPSPGVPQPSPSAMGSESSRVAQ